MANVTDVLEARCLAYMGLQSIFGTPPTAVQIDVLKDISVQHAFELLARNDTYKQSVSEFFGFLENFEFDEALSDEYNHLFIGPGKLAAHPWESVFRQRDTLLFAESTLEVRRSYLAQGYAPKLFPHVADDHIALELDFMRRLSQSADEGLCRSDASIVKSCMDASRSFLDEHLLVWVDSYAEALASTTQGFYRDAARLLPSFVANDRVVIEEIFSSL